MFQRATKKNAKLRAAIFGPSGSGKTYSALRIATGMGGKIAVIDTENHSACKYADRFTFDVCELTDDTSIKAVVDAMQQASDYNVLIIDSLSHPWQELLTEVDELARTKYRGNSWSAWSEGTPKQRQLVRAILSFPGHVLVTMRSKTEWNTDKDEKTGKSKPTRVGLTPEQGKGIEYEFDMLIEVTPEHMATVIKDRTGGKYQDKIIEKPGEEFGKALIEWLNSAPLINPDDEPVTTADKKEAIHKVTEQLACADSQLDPAKLIASVAASEQRPIKTKGDLKAIVEAILSGSYDLFTGNKIPA